MDDKKTPEGLSVEELEKNVPFNAHSILEFALENWKLIALVLGALLVVVAAASGIGAYRDYSRAKAQNELGLILIQKQGADRVAALEGFLKEAPSSMRDGVRLELASALMESSKFEPAAAVWKDLAETGDEAIRYVAYLGQAKCLQLGGKPGDAVALLTPLKDKAPKSFKTVLARQLASAAEDAGNYKLAVQAYQEISEVEQNDMNRQFIASRIEALKAKL